MNQSSDKVQIGIVGAGRFANVHLEHFNKVPNAQVVALCRRNQSELDSILKQWNIPQGYTDYKDMLKNPDIDAISIITPTDSHKQIALDAIAANKHVLCDKPLAMTTSDAKEMLQAAEKAGVIHSTNFNQRGNTAVGRLKRYVDNGFIGSIRHASIWWGISTAPEDSKVLSWRFTPEKGGGVVYELIHVFDMLRFIGGEVASICAKLETHMKFRTFTDNKDGFDIVTPDSAAYIVEWKDTGYAVVLVSFASKGTSPDGMSIPRIEISGDKGRIETVGRYSLQGVTGPNGPLALLEPGHPYPQPYSRFVEAVITQDQSKIETSFYDGMKALEILEAAYKSWESKSWVSI